MDIHDFGGVVWAIFIAIAVISSIARSARRAGVRLQGPVAPVEPVPPHVQRVPNVVPTVVAPTVVMPNIVVARTIASSTAVPSAIVPPPVTMLRTQAVRELVSVIPSVASTKVLAQPRDYIRSPALGIIALEVLGPPRALQEWIPRA